MLVKCRACGKKIDKQSAYMTLHNNIKWYYCSKEEIDKIEAAKKVKDDIYNIICDIFGYKVQNTVLWKEIAIWKTLADDAKILEYLQENNNRIDIAMQKVKDSAEYNKIRYFSAILKNSIKDFNVTNHTENEEVGKESSFILFDKPVAKKQERKSFADLEE